MMNQHEQKHSGSARDNEWAVILAGGDGTRLRSLTRQSYAAGSLRAARFLGSKSTGLYDMFDVLGL